MSRSVNLEYRVDDFQPLAVAHDGVASRQRRSSLSFSKRSS